MDQPVNTAVGRFAPTPSGRMHIGNVYAMLAAWLSAKSQVNPVIGLPGRVFLRIEDVDGPRAVPDADKWIMDDLHWLGLDWDGEPVYQSRRSAIYREALCALQSIDLDTVAPLGDRSHVSGKVLVTRGDSSVSAGRLPDVPKGSAGRFPLVYPCFCSRADLRAACAPQEGDRFLIYPGTCRALLAGDPNEVRSRLEARRRHSWRIAVPDDEMGGGSVAFDDRVFGRQVFDLARDVGDTVIRRSDGVFAYQLVVVVDDLLMGVNDIVRGRDLLRSTALQVWIRKALIASGFAERYGIGSDDVAESDRGDAAGKARPVGTSVNPVYAHVPLIDAPSGQRLAKRKRSPDLGVLRAAGVEPEQVIGYCAWLLGVRKSDGIGNCGAAGPVPMDAQEALERFSWEQVKTDVSDRKLTVNWESELVSPKSATVA